MTINEVLRTIERLGGALKVDAGKLRYRIRPEAMSTELRSALSQHRLSLISTLQGAPVAGVQLFLNDGKGRGCAPEEAESWCWEGAPAWIPIAERPLPTVALDLHPAAKLRCQQCGQRSFKLTWQTFKNETKHLRADCGACGVHVGYLKPPPKNVDLIYRAA